MYDINVSNFFYINSRIYVAGFWYMASLIHMSNFDWMQLRYHCRNKYKLSFFLFTSRAVKYKYLRIGITNKCVGVFSKFVKNFFTTQFLQDDFMNLEEEYKQFKIKFYAIFFRNKIVHLSSFHYYNKYSLINFLIPLSTKYNLFNYWFKEYNSYLCRYYYYFLFTINIIYTLIYNKTFLKYMNVYY